MTTLVAFVSAVIVMTISAPAYAGRGHSQPNTSGATPESGARFGSRAANLLGADNAEQPFLQMVNQTLSLSQVLEIINAQEPGTQLDTTIVNENGRTVYVVRWQASRGRIIIFRVDAQTGQIIGRQG